MARLVSPNALLVPTQATINGIEEYIRWAEREVPSQIPFAMDNLVHYMAITNQKLARKMAGGPYDPGARNPVLAWRTPAEGIRRITQRYYFGWKVKQIRLGHWRLYNDSREAYFIEFGISSVGFGGNRWVPSRRMRRPVRKLSLIQTMRYMMTTHAYHRTWCEIYANPRHKHLSKGFTQVVQSPAKGSFRGPLGPLP